jgi:pilus assembly protein CpaF
VIVNPFKVYKEDVISEEKSIKDTNSNEDINIKNENIDISKIQKYIINNYIEYLQKDLKAEVASKIKKYLYEKYSLKDENKIQEIVQKVINKMFGYDILQKYIDMVNVTDIRVVKFDRIYIKKMGEWEKVEEKFENEEIFEEYIRYCVLKNNSNINFDNSIVIVSDKKYNLRIEVGISPVNAISPSIVIRIHRHNKKITLESLFLVENMLDSFTYKFILDAIKTEKNIVISGKGGSGKTSFLRAIIDRIPEEKAITISEETTELYIENKNVIQREVLNNREKDKKITLEKLMKHSLVMSNDVLVVGELKGEETASFVDAISTGHNGFATVHSNSASNTLDRLIILFKRDIRAQQYTEKFIAQILSSSIDYLIYLEKYKVCEIVSLDFDRENDKIKTNLIYDIKSIENVKYIKNKKENKVKKEKNKIIDLKKGEGNDIC